MYASTEELAALCQALRDDFPGAFYSPHHRSYGHNALGAYEEMIELGKSTGCPIRKLSAKLSCFSGSAFLTRQDLTHATMNFTENKGKAGVLLDMIDDALKQDIDVTLDTYPYLPGSTTLAALLPSWASSGGPSETLKRLEDDDTRELIRVAVEETGCDGGHGIPTNWDEIQV